LLLSFQIEFESKEKKEAIFIYLIEIKVNIEATIYLLIIELVFFYVISEKKKKKKRREKKG